MPKSLYLTKSVYALGEEAGEEVGTMEAAERGLYAAAVSFVVPEEILALCQLLLGTGGGEYLLAGIGMIA